MNNPKQISLNDLSRLKEILKGAIKKGEMLFTGQKKYRAIYP